jgi:hypothetical protein
MDCAVIIQEVPWGPNQPVGPELYTSLGSVLEFRVAGDLYDKVCTISLIDEQELIHSAV